MTGFLKNETPEKCVVKFCGLRSKCYSMKMEEEVDDLVKQFALLKSVSYDSQLWGLKQERKKKEGKKQSEILRAKGVKKYVRDKQKFETYEKSLFSMQEVKLKQASLQSKNHQSMLIEQEKVGISPFDAKRALTCLIHTVPYGSVLLEYRKEKGQCYACAHPEDLF